MLVMSKSLFLEVANILTILVFATVKLRDHVQDLVHNYLNDEVRLQKLKYQPM